MASSLERITIHSLHDDEDDDDQHNNHGLSRLSICTRTNYSMYDDDDDDDMGIHISRLSMEESKTGFESSDGDADGELSEKEEIAGELTDSDKEVDPSGGWGYSNPATPVVRTRREELSQGIDIRKYGSENETARAGDSRCSWRRKLKGGRVGEKWLEKAWEVKKRRASLDNDCNNKGLCIDVDEVKACRDLGFELNRELWTLDVPSRRISSSTMDYSSSGGNSPVADLIISSPGDDPRDVKARLKVWAQAVALASTAYLSTNHDT